MTTRTRIRAAVLALAVVLALTACDSEAETTSQNLSQAADNFEVNRRITFVNGITDIDLRTSGQEG